MPNGAAAAANIDGVVGTKPKGRSFSGPFRPRPSSPDRRRWSRSIRRSRADHARVLELRRARRAHDVGYGEPRFGAVALARLAYGSERLSVADVVRRMNDGHSFKYPRLGERQNCSRGKAPAFRLRWSSGTSSPARTMLSTPGARSGFCAGFGCRSKLESRRSRSRTSTAAT